MTRHLKGRQAVFVVRVSDDWKPARPWDVPPGFQSGELHAKNLAMYEAQGFARTFNRRQLQFVYSNTWDGTWALVSKHLKARRHGRYGSVKGGAS